ncbi:YbaN family protein [Catenovulum sediminis]|uniref:Inner membrane protein n=1 Tax=Catenovulum sediminis TaxID=1740262 RepID=A0ABV1RGG7_9ALTE|nr:YbaN family protein [Catenovulum sediminis]
MASIVRILLIFAGWGALALGILGAILPVLPTTPFVLLAAGCFAKSSPRFHSWLLKRPYFGPLIQDYQTYRGISRSSKQKAISLIWISMAISIFVTAKLWLAMLLITIAICVSLYLWRMPDAPEKIS